MAALRSDHGTYRVFRVLQVNKVELKAENIRPNDEKVEEESGMVVPTTPEACKETMEKINKFVKDVSGSCRQTEPGSGTSETDRGQHAVF